jgi:hypothetical protein
MGSVAVEYLLHSGRDEHRGEDAPEPVASSTVSARGDSVGSFILHPSSLSHFWFPLASPLVFFLRFP